MTSPKYVSVLKKKESQGLCLTKKFLGQVFTGMFNEFFFVFVSRHVFFGMYSMACVFRLAFQGIFFGFMFTACIQRHAFCFISLNAGILRHVFCVICFTASNVTASDLRHLFYRKYFTACVLRQLCTPLFNVLYR